MIITRKRILSFVFLSLFSLLQLAGFTFLVQPARADDALFDSQIGINDIGKAYGKGVNNKPADIRVVIVNIVQITLGFLAVIFLVLTIYAGFRYMTSAGNDDQAKKAISQITSAVIGLLIIIASWALTSAIIRYLTRAVNDSGRIID